MLKPDDEAKKIYFAIFKKKIPAQIQYHFGIISKKIDDKYAEKEVRKYQRCIERVGDLEALEVTARYFKKLPILTEKFKIMIYLAETLPENYTIFINEQPKHYVGYISLMVSVFCTFCKFIKGLFLYLIYRL